MSKGAVYYQSTVRGLMNPTGEHDITYLGRVFRIPRSEHGTVRQLEWEISPKELFEECVTLHNGEQAERMPGCVIERFEIVDQPTGDVLVMYRVPCRPVQGSLE